MKVLRYPTQKISRPKQGILGWVERQVKEEEEAQFKFLPTTTTVDDPAPFRSSRKAPKALTRRRPPPAGRPACLSAKSRDAAAEKPARPHHHAGRPATPF